MPPRRKNKTLTYLLPDLPAGSSQPLASESVIHQYSDIRSDGSVALSAVSRPVPSASMESPLVSDTEHVSQDQDHVQFEVDIQEYARELREMTHSANGFIIIVTHSCRNCSNEKGAENISIYCGALSCQACVLQAHHALPFHRIEQWNGSFFEKRQLKALGLRIQLGHWHDGNRCPRPIHAAGDDFLVIDTNGIHEIGLDFCGCLTNGTPTQQLIRAGLYPATTTNPRTAATINVLRHFHLNFLESKCSAYDFYYSLARQTDNMGLSGTQDRYDEFLRMTKQWRNLQLLKRAGRGNSTSGVAGTQPGECALLCPACPHPGKNLPADWDQAPEDRRFLFALFLAIDANFRLKRKDVSSEAKDPGLGHGWAFYCQVEEYMSHVKKHWNDRQPKSRCVAHDAVDKPDREARGTASSGIGAVDCARHNMKRSLSVGDLQLGERYINMDFMFFRSVSGTDLVSFFVSYDIACQWHINLWERMAKYSNHLLSIDHGTRYFVFLVPKFHLPAHIEECNIRFSFNLTRSVGMTDGEAPERVWAATNPLAGSTMNMGPGSRRDALDDFFNDQNHKKIIGLGMSYLLMLGSSGPNIRKTQSYWKPLAELGNCANWSQCAPELSILPVGASMMQLSNTLVSRWI
ncbi:CxC2 domain-containing protein [Mycena indigotica]|uniref:CxC2 domain-containing protein n=1 Tax=Mycena indigotica TaxID=2126181 RepID=A0A8H6W935_9AGAR|nr:CxC2 domain-containing protein [Mycena indigotica]KAF7306198.1 CxC2 domain-containing protein [Mycena indigotica]